MKQLFIFLFVAYTMPVAAQINLNKGQQIIITTNNTQTSDMGFEMKNNAELITLLEVKDIKDDKYIVSKTLTTAVIDAEGMGQSMNYDSRKESDKNSQIAGSIEPLLNKAVLYYVTKSGISTPVNPNESKEMVNGISDAREMNDIAMDNIFIIIDDQKIQSKSWQKFDSAKDYKISTSYSLSTITEEEATINFTSSGTVNTTMEQQGMQMQMNMVTKSTGTIIVDRKTNITKNFQSVEDTSGTIEVAGNNVPISSSRKSSMHFVVK